MAKTNTTEPPKRGGKENGYSSATLHRKRDEKRRDADARQLVYEDLTLTQRLQRATGRRGESKAEVARIEKLIGAQKGKKNGN